MICEISLPITYKHLKNNTIKSDTLMNYLNQMKEVRVKNNLILSGILNTEDKWATNPIIWINNQAYMIKPIRSTPNVKEVFQMAINLQVKEGKIQTNLLNIRKVRITIP